MSWLIYLRQSVKNLLKNPFRSFLTLLGISIGIACVVTINSIGEGFNESIKSDIAALGANSIVIYSFTLEYEGGRDVSNFEWCNIALKDVTDIKKQFKEIKYVIPTIGTWQNNVSYKGNKTKTSLLGTAPEFFLTGGKKLTSGVFWGELDLLRGNRVCVLGKMISDRIFLSQDPVEKNILVEGIPFKVLGILDKMPERGFNMQDVDNAVIMPYTTLQNKIIGKRYSYIDEAKIIAEDGTDIDGLIGEIKDFLRNKLKVKKDDKIKFTVERPEIFSKIIEKMVKEYTKFLVFAAGIGLFIGGLGIMNIMLVSIAERTKEIGIRMSVGATSFDIIKQFLIEAVILCLIGGAIGMALSYPLAGLMTKAMKFPSKISIGIIIVAFLYSCAIGVFFGLYPAYTASKLDPVEAIRSE